MASTAPLVKVYTDALCGRAVYVHAGLKGRATRFSFEPDRKLSLIEKFWFARPAHAELVVMRCRQDFAAVGAKRTHGWIDLPPAAVVEVVKDVAAALGARWQTEDQIERDAQKVVAEVIASVEAARQNGGLKEVNAEYKRYRQAQIDKREPAIPYSAHIAQFTRLLVVRAAQKSMQ